MIKKRNLIVLAIFIFIALVFISPIFNNFSNGGVHDWDQHMFYNEAPRKTIMEFKQFPLWNPYYCGGLPLLANPQSTFLSPFFLSVLLFGAVYGLKLNIFLHLVLGLFGMYLLGKHLKLGELGSYLTAFIYMLSGVFAAHIAAGHTTHFPMAFIPWIFLFFLKSKENIKYIIPAALFSVAMIFAGGIYPFFYTLLFLIIYSIFQSLKKKNISLIKPLIVLFLIVFLLGAIKFLPVMDFSNDLQNGKVELESGSFSLNLFFRSLVINQDIKDIPLGNAIFYNLPFHWHEYHSYIGLIALILVLLGAIFVFKKIWPLILTCLTFIIISFGENSYLNLWKLLHSLPFFSSLYAPIRLNMIIIFCFALFAGYAISRLEKKKIPRYITLILTIIILINLIFINSAWLTKAFTVKPLEIEKGTFHQKINENFLNLSDEMYPYILMNKGTINCYERSYLPIRALPIQNTDYKGEFYYLNSNSTPKIVYFSPNKIKLNINITEQYTLIVNQNYHDGWHIKDKEVENYDGLISFKVNPKDNIITLYYLPYSFIIGLILTVLGILLCIFIYKKNYKN